MNVDEAGRALATWAERIQAAQRSGQATRALDRLAATQANLERAYHAIHATTPAQSLERFVFRTGKFVEEATRVLGPS